jgi:hypothetical protein
MTDLTADGYETSDYITAGNHIIKKILKCPSKSLSVGVS